MENETKSYTDMSRDELRTAVNEYNALAEQKTPDPLLQPAGTPTGLTEEQKVKLNDNWLTHIWKKPSHTWSAEETAAVRQTSLRVLRERDA